MVKKKRKRTGYSLIVAIGLFLLIAVLLYGLYYVNDVRTELWDSSLSTIIENTDRAADVVDGKIRAEKRSLEVQVNALESLDSSNIDTISFLMDGFDSKEYSTTLIVGATTYPAKNSYNESLPGAADTKINIVPPFLSANSGKRVIALTKTMAFQDGVTGSFIREIPVNDLNDAFTVSFFQDRGHSYMIDEQGEILFRSVTTSGNKTSHNLFAIFESETGNEQSTINEVKELVAGLVGHCSNIMAWINCTIFHPLNRHSGYWCLLSRRILSPSKRETFWGKPLFFRGLSSLVSYSWSGCLLSENARIKSESNRKISWKSK